MVLLADHMMDVFCSINAGRMVRTTDLGPISTTIDAAVTVMASTAVAATAATMAIAISPANGATIELISLNDNRYHF